MKINTIKFFWNGIKVNGEREIVHLGAQDCGDCIRIAYNWKWSKKFYADLKIKKHFETRVTLYTFAAI